MVPAQIAAILENAFLAWILLFFAVIVLKMLRGDITTDGLLQRPGADTRADPERILVLALTLGVAAHYLFTGLTALPVFNDDGIRVMPDIPESILVLLGSANGVYLGGKIMRRAP